MPVSFPPQIPWSRMKQREVVFLWSLVLSKLMLCWNGRVLACYARAWKACSVGNIPEELLQLRSVRKYFTDNEGVANIQLYDWWQQNQKKKSCCVCSLCKQLWNLIETVSIGHNFHMLGFHTIAKCPTGNPEGFTIPLSLHWIQCT